jgi:hypothetical protein
MSTIVFHRHSDPFVFYGVHIKLGGKQIVLGQNETQSIDLPAGNYIIRSGFRLIYQGKPVSINLSEDETIEFDVNMNVDLSNPMDSLNWSLRFHNLILLSLTDVGTVVTNDKVKSFNKPSRLYIFLLSLISLLPLIYLAKLPVDANNNFFILIIPILTAITYGFFSISRNKFYIMPYLSELFSALFYLIIGIIYHLYFWYFLASILFVLFYFNKRNNRKFF